MAGTPAEKKLDLKYIIWVCIGLVLSHLRSKMDMTRYCRMQNVKTLGCMFISLFARVSATFALIAKCAILLNCVIGT